MSTGETFIVKIYIISTISDVFTNVCIGIARLEPWCDVQESDRNPDINVISYQNLKCDD